MLPTRTAIAGAVLLLLASLATADPYLQSRTTVVSPLVPVVNAGVAFCEFVSPGLPTNCNAGGVGAAFFDVSSFNSGTNPAASKGTCLVSKVTTSIGVVNYVCAADLDDDFIITASDQSYTGSVADGVSSSSVGVCFTADSAAGGSDWDEVVVFVTTGLPAPPYAGGLANTVLDLQDVASC